MCGICGIAASDGERPVDVDVLRRMIAILRHRGPDSEAVHIEPGVGLGAARLRIIDTQAGDQPMTVGSTSVVFNGEIYNHRELRRELEAGGTRFRTDTDTEVLLHAYRRWGSKFLSRLRGMFAVAIWDSRKRRMLLARDRLGLKPVFYAVREDALLFGSEQKAILVADSEPARLSLPGMFDLFRFGFVHGANSLFEGMRPLPPGHCLTYQAGRVEIERYWDLHFDPVSRPAEEWASVLLHKLKETARIHLRSDVPVAALLSGGVDSSGSVALMAEASHRPMDTFSLGFEAPETDEVSQVRMLDEFAGHEINGHRVVLRDADFALMPQALWHGEQMCTWGTEIAQFVLFRDLSRHFKVAFTGEGADEIFGSYDYFRNERVLGRLSRLPLPMRQLLTRLPAVERRWPGACRVLRGPSGWGDRRYANTVGPPQVSGLEKLFSPDIRAQLGPHFDAEPEEQDVPVGFEGWEPFLQLQYKDIFGRLSSLFLPKLDRMSMAHGVEVRAPYLDHEVVELSAAIPVSLKLRGTRDKWILRRALSELLPPQIAWRKKRGFAAPVHRWFRQPLPEFATELLSENSLRDKGHFDPSFVRRILDGGPEIRGANHRLLMAVLQVQLWDALFLGRSGEGLASAPG